MSEHPTSSSLKTYFIIWVALLAATALTTYAASIDLGRFNAAVALTIASGKATLVALFFMHIKGASERFTKVVVISALFFLLILLCLSMSDYATRAWS